MEQSAEREKKDPSRLYKTLSPRPEPLRIWISALFALFAYLVPVFPDNTAIAVAFLAAVVLYTAFMTRVAVAIVSVCAGILILFLFFGVTPAALICAAVAGSAAMVWELISMRVPAAYGMLAIPLSAVLLVLLLPGNISVLPILLMLPVLVLLSVAMFCMLPRTTAACLTAGGYLAAGLISLVVFLWNNGEVSFAALGNLLERLQEELLQTALLLRDRLITLWEETAAKENGDAFRNAAETLKSVLNVTVLREVISSAFRVFPGAVLGLCAVLGYLTHTYLLLCCNGCGWRDRLPEQMRIFRMSGTSALLYGVALTVTFFVTPQGLFGALCWNLSLMLLPGFFRLGLGILSGFLRATRGEGNFLLLCGLLCLFCCLGTEAFRLISLIGTFGVLSGILRRKRNADSDDSDDESAPHR